MLKKEFIMERIDRQIENSYTLGKEEWPALRKNFDRASGDEGYLIKEAFISLFKTKAYLPHSPVGAAAGGIIFSMLVCLSTIPFPSQRDVDEIDRLSLAQMALALVWLFPDRYRYIIEESNQSRMRTAADHRRLLFQSLASVIPDGPDKPSYNLSRACQLALRNSTEVCHEMSLDLCRQNYDDDGDEIYHDLLEVLFSTQEERHPALARAPSDAFHPTAKELAAKYNLGRLYDNYSGAPF